MALSYPQERIDLAAAFRWFSYAFVFLSKVAKRRESQLSHAGRQTAPSRVITVSGREFCPLRISASEVH